MIRLEQDAGKDGENGFILKGSVPSVKFLV